jgi:hypothetical protein
MARSLENLRPQLHVSAISSISSPSVTPANLLHGPQPYPPQNVDPTQSTPLPTNFLAAIPGIDKVTKVPGAEYTKTSTQSSDSLAKNTITYQSHRNFLHGEEFPSLTRKDMTIARYCTSNSCKSTPPTLSCDKPRRQATPGYLRTLHLILPQRNKEFISKST